MSRFPVRLDRFALMLALCCVESSVVIAAADPAAIAETAAEAAQKPIKPPSPARLPDGHPNWTGFWTPAGGLLEVDIGLGGTPPPPPPGAPKPPPPPPFPFTQFSALKSPYKEQYEEMKAKFMAGKAEDPVALCLPPGMPRMMVMAYGMELLQTPGQIAITSEWQAASRRIWLDRKTHPPADELDPSYAGDSIGHWQGDTLVVDTIGIRDDVPLNFTGLPHSPQLHVTERFHQTTPGTLVDDITINDPGAFVKPWYEHQVYHYRPDLRIEEYVCLENNRNVGAEGQATFKK